MFLKALRQGISFKKLNETFQNSGKLPAPPPPLKKTKLDETNKNTETGENVDDNEIEDFKSSYVLTMSQLCPENNEGDEIQSAMDYTFEPFEEVNVIKIDFLADFLKLNQFGANSWISWV